MKKVVLFALVCLFSTNAAAYTCDEMYSDCIAKSYDRLKCLYFFDGFLTAFLREQPYSYFVRCDSYETDKYIDRFVTLYRRNTFTINGSAYHAMIETIKNLCPSTQDEDGIILKQLKHDPHYDIFDNN